MVDESRRSHKLAPFVRQQSGLMNEIAIFHQLRIWFVPPVAPQQSNKTDDPHRQHDPGGAPD
jgi:hypothetical protein